MEVDGDDGGGVDKSILLRWSNLALPAGRLLVGASITVNVTDPTGGTYGVYSVLRDWVENQVTWNERAAGAVRAAAGALGAVDRGTTSLAAASGGTGSQTINLIQPASRSCEIGSRAQPPTAVSSSPTPMTTDGFDFDARETAVAANRPKLTLVHIAAPTPMTPGDVNEDGVLSAADIDELFAAVAAGSGDVVFDVDGNAAVNLADVDRLVHVILDADMATRTLTMPSTAATWPCSREFRPRCRRHVVARRFRWQWRASISPTWCCCRATSASRCVARRLAGGALVRSCADGSAGSIEFWLARHGRRDHVAGDKRLPNALRRATHGARNGESMVGNPGRD